MIPGRTGREWRSESGKGESQQKVYDEGAVTVGIWAQSHRKPSEKLRGTRLRTVPPKGREAGVFIDQLRSIHVRVTPKPLTSQDYQPAPNENQAPWQENTLREKQEALG